jgi:hypothetical protein
VATGRRTPRAGSGAGAGAGSAGPSSVVGSGACDRGALGHVLPLLADDHEFVTNMDQIAFAGVELQDLTGLG